MPVVFSIRGENHYVFQDGENFSREIRSNEELSRDEIRELKSNMNKHFRCVDDDGTTYFWGLCNEESFLPLDMVGYSYGCTEIHYKNGKTGKWEQL